MPPVILDFELVGAGRAPAHGALIFLKHRFRPHRVFSLLSFLISLVLFQTPGTKQTGARQSQAPPDSLARALERPCLPLLYPPYATSDIHVRAAFGERILGEKAAKLSRRRCERRGRSS